MARGVSREIAKAERSRRKSEGRRVISGVEAMSFVSLRRLWVEGKEGEKGELGFFGGSSSPKRRPPSPFHQFYSLGSRIKSKKP